MNFQACFGVLLWVLANTTTPRLAYSKEFYQPPFQDYAMNDSLYPKTLIEHVKLAINPRFTHWVLFSNGTYIIIEDKTIADDSAFAKKIMREYGPVHAGTPAGDFSVTHLSRTDGWVVSGNYYGMYTYVSPSELKKAGVQNPSDVDVGLFGRRKRENDGKECRVIFVSKQMDFEIS
jgi:hypothetical protein